MEVRATRATETERGREATICRRSVLQCHHTVQGLGGERRRLRDFGGLGDNFQAGPESHAEGRPLARGRRG